MVLPMSFLATPVAVVRTTTQALHNFDTGRFAVRIAALYRLSFRPFCLRSRVMSTRVRMSLFDFSFALRM